MVVRSRCTGMQRKSRDLIVCALLITAAHGPAIAQGRPADPARVAASVARDTVHVQIVPQQTDGIVAAAAWTGDDRFVATVHPIARNVIVWDVARRHIVNRIDFPLFRPEANIDVWDATVKNATVLVVRANIRDLDGSFCTAVTMQIDLARADPWQVDTGEPMGPCLASGRQHDVVASHDGRLKLDYSDYPARIKTSGGKPLRDLAKPEPTMAFGAARSPDGQRIALINDGDDVAPAPGEGRHTRVTIFDLANWKISASFRVDGYYSQVAWLDDDRLFLPANDISGAASQMPDMNSASLIMDAQSGQTLSPQIDVRCSTLALPGGALIGIGGSTCPDAAVVGQQLERFDPKAGWKPFGSVNFGAAFIDMLAATPDGKTLIVITGAYPPDSSTPQQPAPAAAPIQPSIYAIDAKAGTLIASAPMPPGTTSAQIDFMPDSSAIGIRVDLQNYRWTMTDAAPVAIGDAETPVARLARETATGTGAGWYEQTADTTNAPISAVRVEDGKREARVLFDNVVAEGSIPDSPLRWVVTSLDGIVLWRPRPDMPFASPEVLRTYIFDSRHFLTLAPDGRYDTDLGADSPYFRWVVSDAPLQSLGPQTFMRNFFEPVLGPKLMTCTVVDNCGKILRLIADVATLNRVLPHVSITRVRQKSASNVAQVDVEVRMGRKASSPNGRTRSDGYDLRLFRDGSLVSRSPDADPDAVLFDKAKWRSDNHLAVNHAGVTRKSFTVRMPSGSAPVEFTAYAFNEDRVKSDTATRISETPRPVRHARRVYVVALGIDDYSLQRLRLNFAASDARLISARLATLPGGEATHLLTLADDGAPGSPKITRANLADVFGILGGQPRKAALARLAAQGIDASMLDVAGPDDAVVISFSGHGWADPQGNFYLLPADAVWPDETATPDIATLVSTADMSRFLRRIDAGEIALIIDACHSAASVASGGFRAGPMGDAGLGQLAFDKRMRILAAAQADDVALESATLRQGLLTFALASEGLTATGGMADGNGDGVIALDEWLRYATRRLPALSRDVRAGRISSKTTAARGVVFLNQTDAPTATQEPALFDFTEMPSSLVLRRLAP